MSKLNPWYSLSLLKVAYFLAFLTYGLGDGISAAYMMEKTGFVSEINPIFRFIYASSGAPGVIAIKIWVTFVIIFLTWIISKKTNTYWTVIGFLTSLSIGVILSTISNIFITAYGVELLPPISIIFLFLFSVLLLTGIGDIYDKKTLEIHAYVSDDKNINGI